MDVTDNEPRARAPVRAERKEAWCEPEIIDLPPLTDVTLQSPIGCTVDPVTGEVICGRVPGRPRPPMMP
jgi:hypothetical protein